MNGAPDFARCSCPIVRCAVVLAWKADYRLRGGDTWFSLYRCFDCGGIRGRPDDNLTQAIEQGTPHTWRRLRDLTRTN